MPPAPTMPSTVGLANVGLEAIEDGAEPGRKNLAQHAEEGLEGPGAS